jgi:predicted membrane protein
MTGLANANFEEMEFSGGAGDYTLDFSGDLQRDATVRVKGGVGEITIIVSEDVKATVSVTKGVRSVDTDGSWTVEGDDYSTGAKEGPELRIYVEVGVGSLNLVSK